jgi:aarF domain-containing kinase
MRSFGFKTKFSRDDVMVKYARLFFDNDAEGKALGCATPQLYLLKLSMMDPLQDVPDAAVFVARASYMFRGMGSMFNEQICTAHRWANHALAAISASNAVHKKDG